MMDKIKIIGLQHDTHWKAPTENQMLIERELSSLSADIMLLPEMFATGFCMDAAEISLEHPQILSWMKRIAQEKNTALCGSVAVEDKGQYYNRLYFVEPSGKVTHYDKRHLFSYAREDEFYTPGKEKVIVEYLGWKILLQVCYDLRFPIFQRNLDNYDLMLNVASWPSTRMEAWNTLLKARAIENQAYVFGLNRTGKDGNHLQYTGESHCFFADGKEISQSHGKLVTAVLDKNNLFDFRNRFPFLEDRDHFSLKE